MRKILVPLDTSPAGEEILGEVALVAPSDAEVDLLHVVPAPPLPVGASPTAHLDLEGQALAYLETARRRLHGFRGIELVRAGDPADAILQVALERNVDLVAMTTHARAGLAHWFLGSVAEAVVRKTQLPVLLRRPGVPPPAAAALRRILVPLDGSEHSETILETVEPLAARTGAEVILLHVVSAVRDPAPQWAVHGPLSLGAAPEYRFQEMADRIGLRSGIDVWPAVTRGDPAAQILQEARVLKADLIAMTTHARTGLARTVVGSVAAGVLRGAAGAVLLRKPLVRKETAHE
jgi:nucleotide-binding universal stress UspA family protein